MKVLIIEDEKQLSEILVALLTQQGYQVDTAYDGISGEDAALSGIYDVILLDIMLPKRDGMKVLATLRKEKISTPVLMLTAKNEIDDRIQGLDTGADDYMTKPFASGELLARIRAMTRRKGEYTGDELIFGRTVLDKNTHLLNCGNHKIKLGSKEYQILELLMQNSRQIIPKERIIEKIWGYDTDAEYNAVEVYISFLRKKLTALHSDMQIKTIRSVGYTLEETL